MKQIVVIAGGSGLVGKNLSAHLAQNNFEVRILSRTPSGKSDYKEFYWSYKDDKIETGALDNVDVIINLTGANIGAKSWTKTRREEIIDSRVETAKFLMKKCHEQNHFPKNYISSSGINAYGYDHSAKIYNEQEPFGKDFLSQVVEKWEEGADYFLAHSKVCKIRTPIVLAKKGGALKKMMPIVNWGIASPLGSGEQPMPWVHIDDLSKLFLYAIEQNLEGAYNANASKAPTNAEFMKALAKAKKRPYFMPKVPAFILKFVFGKMSEMMLNGCRADNSKILATGFEFKHVELFEAFKVLYQK